MAVGRTQKGRARAERGREWAPRSRPLLRCEDHGDPVALQGAQLGTLGDRWVEPFLAANRAHLARLGVGTEVRAAGGLHVALTPGSRIGAVPLLSPSTRRVVAGLLVVPRFRWSALGAVFQATGFAVEPAVGGAALVPGSAREVPPWLLAAPVLRRLEALLAHQRRGFVDREDERSAPRGRIDWHAWATRNVPAGRWASFRCRFPDPAHDPDVLAAVRWTLARLQEELAPVADAPVGRRLLEKAAALTAQVGPGPARPPGRERPGDGSAFLAEALEAIGWVAEERGLGGARALDGLPWDVDVRALWEAWVASFFAELGPRLGLVPEPRGRMRALRWEGALTSMGHLAPDAALLGTDRAVWIDAKYKAHLHLLARHGWAGLSEDVRAGHRADLHQALAYASLNAAAAVDTVLVYPHLGRDGARPPHATSALGLGRRRIRLVLGTLPFGFRGPAQRDEALQEWRALLAA